VCLGYLVITALKGPDSGDYYVVSLNLAVQNLPKRKSPDSPFRMGAMFGCFPILYRRKGDARIQGYAQLQAVPQTKKLAEIQRYTVNSTDFGVQSAKRV
jgi:hypothetical protein